MKLTLVLFISLWIKSVLGARYQIEPRLEENSGIADYCFVGSRYKQFDSTREFCCEGSIKSKSTVEEPCCTKILADGTNTRCCNGLSVSMHNLKNALCCRNVLFNKDVDFCHNGIVYPSNESPANTLITSTAKLENYYHTEETVNKENIIICSWATTLSICVSLVIAYVCYALRKRSHCHNTYINMATWSTPTDDFVNRHDSGIENENKCTNQQNSILIRENEPGVVEIDGFVNQSAGDDLPYVSTAGQYLTNKTLKNDVVLLGNEESTQTDTEKTSNMTNVMDRKFDCRHVFDENNTRLELPNSAVSLTLSEDDIADGPVECYASTYRNLNEIYETFGKYMMESEGIVSPTIEYFFPKNKHLRKFAYVDIKYYNCRCDGILCVWRFDCENETELKRVQIPNKSDVDAGQEIVDAYYEILDPGSIRIYLKCFCTLMCTVCHREHESFSLAAYMYFVRIPNDAYRHVRVSVYILDGVSQLPDYSKFVREDEMEVIPVRKNISLPMLVKLKDDLRICLTLWPESQQVWQQQGNIESVIVQLHNISQCHIHGSNGLPYSCDWHFIGIGNHNKLTFNCDIDIAMVHPGDDMRPPPPNKFVLTHEVEFPTTPKTYQSGRDPRRGPIQHPTS